MEKESLYIYKLDTQGGKAKFPNSGIPAKLGEYTYTAQRMAGTPTLTATLNYPACLDEEWTGEEFVEFRGEKYYVGQVPTSSKDNKSIMYKHELQFVSERIVLENVYFMDVVTAGADTYHSNSTSVKFMGDINEFAGRLNASMEKSGIEYSVVIDYNITSDSKLVSLDNVYLADALQSIYTIYELPYYFVGKVCHIGYTENVISTPFEYRKGLVSIKKTNANYKIVNRVTGVGSSDNIPFYYPNDDEKGTIERSQNLMPSIYRESGGAERFYNALNNKYKIPGTNDYYSFKNPYSSNKVKEIKVDFGDIKPTIEGVTNASGKLFGEIADIAFDKNDSDELGTGEENKVFNGTDEYVHSYFYIKLHIYNGDYGFNLFEQGLEGGSAVINMTTGNCAACEFEIGVTYKDGESRAYNPVLVGPTGNLVPGDFEQKVTSQTSQYVESQQDTSKNEVWIAVKKDNASFGVIMPNATNDYKPSIGDKFVITGIKMPKPLVLAAEKKLEEALIKYMSENNDEKFTFSINFSRVFLADNSELADILNENARIYIKYNNREYLLYVNSYTCKADKNCLYDISVELTDKLSANVSALRSTITEIAGDIIGDKLGNGNNISASDIISKVSRHFLSKKQPDRTPYKLSSDTAFEIGEFVSGASGAIVYKDIDTGQTIGELDKLRVRMKAYFETLEIINVNSVGGKLIITPGGSIRVNRVEETDDYYRCYFLAEQDGEKVENRFKTGDQGYCQIFNAKTGISNLVSNRYYWRLVTAVGDDYIDLSKADCDTGSDAPAVGDVINQRGNRTDVDRQNALEFSSVDSFSPSVTLYKGINYYSLTGKDIISYGVDKTSGKAFMNVYGEMYVGDRNGSTFIKYTQSNGVEIKGKLAVGTTIGDGKTIEQALDDATQTAIDTANENISEFTDAITKDIEGLQNQIDGAIETWFNDPVPTLTNYPANEWTTNEEKNVHLGDLYYSGEGKAYRFQMEGNSYVWKLITDSDITKALADAAKAQDTADGKRTVFVKQPTDADSYQVGDLWVNATYGTAYSNDVLRAVTAKSSGSPFSINHWTKASKYTDDTKAEQVQKNVDSLVVSVSTISSTVSGMKDFTDKAFSDGVVDRSEASAIAKYLNNIDTAKADVKNAYEKVYVNALLDGVALTNLTNAYKAFNTSATELSKSINDAISDGITTSTERADVDGKYAAFNLKYGDFIAALNAANKYIQDKINATANDALTQIGGLSYLKKALKEDTSIEGGLIQSSVLALGYTNDGGIYKVMSGTNGIYDSSKLGGGIASWWGGSMKDRGDYATGSIPSDAAKAIIRMDGSGYLADGGIWWGIDGKIHADPQSFIINENQLGDYLELFQIIYKGDTSEIDYMIPQYVMQKVEVATSVKIGNVYLKYDNESNSIYAEGEDGAPAGIWASWMSSMGLNPGTGGGGGGASTLGGLNNVGPWADEVPSADRVMVQLKGATHWTSKPLSEIVGLDTEALGNYLTTNNYAKKSDIPSLSGYATEAWVTTKLGSYATASSLKAVSDKLDDFLTGTDTDTVINKWKELEDFLSGFKETDTLAGALALKADKTQLADYVTLGTTQTITANKKFSVDAASVMSVDNNAKTSTSDYAAIIFRHGGEHIGGIAANKSDNYLYRASVNFTTSYRILDAGNYSSTLDSRYVKKSGDAMTGVLQFSGALNVKHHKYGISTYAPTGSSWEGGYKYFNTAGSAQLGAFGAYGSSNSLNFLYIGKSYEDTWLKVAGGTVVPLEVRSTNATGQVIQVCDASGTGAELGWYSGIGAFIQNDRLSSKPTLSLGGVDSLASGIRFRYSGNYYDVWHGGNLPKSSLWAGEQSHNHGVQENVYTPYQFISTFLNNNWAGLARRGSWDYANNGQITTDWGNMHLAGTAYMAWGCNKTRTMLFITPSTRNAGADLTNEMMFYTCNKPNETYPSRWTRVLTSRNYNKYSPTLTGAGASGTWGIWISGNAASATKLQTARSLWGQAFDGTGNVSGSMSGVGTITPLSNNTYTLGTEGVRFSNAFVTSWIYAGAGMYMNGPAVTRNNSFIELSNGGNEMVVSSGAANDIHINYRAPGYSGRKAPSTWYWRAGSSSSWANFNLGSLAANGNISATGSVTGYSHYASEWYRSTGAYGWYNNTYSGGIYMNNSYWIKTYGKPFYSGNARAIGPSNFNVNIKAESASHAGIEVSSGNYTMGFGCHSNGSWYWWRGTANPGDITNKSYCMQYNGSTWSFYGILHTTVGMYTDGYASALGLNTSSDMRLKNKVRDITIPVRAIAEAPSFEYTWKSGKGGLEAGSSAQYWLNVVTPCVNANPEGYYAMRYGQIALLSCISISKELLKSIGRMESLEDKVKRLEKENRELLEFKRKVEQRLSA